MEWSRPHGATEPGRGDIPALIAALDGALETHDRAQALELAHTAVDEGSVCIPDLYTLVLGPLLARTGEAWQVGTVRVWQEHYTSAVVRTIIESLAGRVIAQQESVPRRGETALLACPPDEPHDLGLRMLFDRMLLAGYDAHFLGADTPLKEICDAVEHFSASLVVLSASTHFHRVRMRDTVGMLTACLPRGTRLAVYGPAFAHSVDCAGTLVLDPEALGLPGRTPAALSRAGEGAG